MKPITLILIGTVAAMLAGCVEWHSSAPDSAQTSIPAWNQLQIGMTRQQVYDLIGKPRRETGEVAEWRGPEIKKGWPSDHPSTTYWRQYEAYFDSQGHLKSTRDFDQADHQ